MFGMRYFIKFTYAYLNNTESIAFTINKQTKLHIYTAIETLVNCHSNEVLLFTVPHTGRDKNRADGMTPI